MRTDERAKVAQALRTVPTHYENMYPDCLFIDLLAQAIDAKGVDYCTCSRHDIPTACYSDIIERLVELIEPEGEDE